MGTWANCLIALLFLGAWSTKYIVRNNILKSIIGHQWISFYDCFTSFWFWPYTLTFIFRLVERRCHFLLWLNESTSDLAKTLFKLVNDSLSCHSQRFFSCAEVTWLKWCYYKWAITGKRCYVVQGFLQSYDAGVSGCPKFISVPTLI